MNTTKADICQHLYNRLKDKDLNKIARADYKLFVEAFLDDIIECLAKGQKIELRGFGSFKVKERKAKVGRNPRTGEKIPIEMHKEPVFKFSRDGKRAFFNKLSPITK